LYVNRNAYIKIGTEREGKREIEIKRIPKNLLSNSYSIFKALATAFSMSKLISCD
jgi:hypothetical protein